jgi:hypothetical protein
MKTIKRYFAAAAMMTVLTAGTALANTGIIIAGTADFGKGEPCTASESSDSSLTGIIIAGFYGIIIAGTPSPTETCGIIIAG